MTVERYGQGRYCNIELEWFQDVGTVYADGSELLSR